MAKSEASAELKSPATREVAQGPLHAPEDPCRQDLHDAIEKLQDARQWRLDAPARAAAQAKRLEEQRQKEMARIRTENERREEQRRVERLVEVAGSYARFVELRAFVELCRGRAGTDAADQEWLEWADGVLRRMDPLSGGVSGVRSSVNSSRIPFLHTSPGLRTDSPQHAER